MCGTVAAVREVNLGAVKYGASTVAGERFAMLIGLLTGKLNANAVQIYEVEVLLQDGSVRVIREATLPYWKPGDPVRIVTGRIKPLSWSRSKPDRARNPRPVRLIWRKPRVRQSPENHRSNRQCPFN